jgi:hypothetical protein
MNSMSRLAIAFLSLGAATSCAIDVAELEPPPAVATAIAPLFQFCPTDYLAPAAYLPVDPVALLSGAASDCTVGTNRSPCAPHHVFTPDPSRERAPLFVFLPGTNMEPDKHDLVLATAASVGYRTIGLSYDNSVSINSGCAGAQQDCAANCPGLLRAEVLRGVDLSPQVDVARGDSIVVRLYRVLEYLDSIDPAGGWSSYYVPTAGAVHPSDIVWEDIVVGGFSQGAGHALYISWVRQVHGLFILDGANDTCVDGLGGPELVADWLTSAPDASAGRPKYGVRHDHGTGDTTTDPVWQHVGLGTGLLSLDCTWSGCAGDVFDIAPPAFASVTAQGFPTSPAICSQHMSMARDDCMPTDLAGATGAALPEDYRLFGSYAVRLCYACDAATCP